MRTTHFIVIAVALLLGMSTPELSVARGGVTHSQGNGIVGMWWGETEVVAGQPISFMPLPTPQSGSPARAAS